MYRILFTKRAIKDIKNLKASHLEPKAKELIELMRNNPFHEPPEYEKLVGNLRGYYSRRINIHNRLVFQVIEMPNAFQEKQFDGYIKIIRMWTHYER